MPERPDRGILQARQDQEQKLILTMLLGLFSILVHVGFPNWAGVVAVSLYELTWIPSAKKDYQYIGL